VPPYLGHVVPSGLMTAANEFLEIKPARKF
jgi:hypothetical protein